MNAKPVIRIVAADFTGEAEANTATLSFSTGDHLRLDFRSIIQDREHLSVIVPPDVFATATAVDGGIAVEWECGIDMDAETLFREANIQAGNSVGPTNFRDWRRAHRLSQVACGTALGIARRTVQLYESGELPVPRTIVLAMRGYDALQGDVAA